MAAKPNVVIIGGSYVGNKAVEAITPLVHRTHNVVLIEKNSHFRHIFAFPRLHAVPGFEQKAFIPYTRPGTANASAFFAPVNAAASSAIETLEGFAPLPSDSIKVVNAVATSVLPGKVILGDGKDPIPYEFLVFATGTGHAELPLERQDKKTGVEIALNHQENVKKAKNIVIAGGGAYGIQLATDLKTYAPTQSKHVTVVHSRTHLLNRFHEGLHDIVSRRCKDLGIDVVLGNRVIVPEGGFPMKTTDEDFDIRLTGGGTVRGDLVILCTGNAPLSSPIKNLAPSALDESGYIRVKPTLQVDAPDLSKIFALGDVANTGAHKAARPGSAQAGVVARNIWKLILAGQSNQEIKLEEYHPDSAGINLSLGLNESVKFRNPTLQDAKPWIQWTETGSRKFDVGCSRMWTARASWAGADSYHL